MLLREAWVEGLTFRIYRICTHRNCKSSEIYIYCSKIYSIKSSISKVGFCVLLKVTKSEVDMSEPYSHFLDRSPLIESWLEGLKINFIFISLLSACSLKAIALTKSIYVQV